MDGAGLLAKVKDPDAGPATSMLQVFVVPALRHGGGRGGLQLKMAGELCAYSASHVEPAMRRLVEHAASVVIDLSESGSSMPRACNSSTNSPTAGMRSGSSTSTRLTRIFEIAGLDRLLRKGRRPPAEGSWYRGCTYRG